MKEIERRERCKTCDPFSEQSMNLIKGGMKEKEIFVKIFFTLLFVLFGKYEMKGIRMLIGTVDTLDDRMVHSKSRE